MSAEPGGPFVVLCKPGRHDYGVYTQKAWQGTMIAHDVLTGLTPAGAEAACAALNVLANMLQDNAALKAPAREPVYRGEVTLTQEQRDVLEQFARESGWSEEPRRIARAVLDQLKEVPEGDG